MDIKPGTTDVITYFKLVDPTAGTPETGLTISDLTINYVRDGAARVGASATELSSVTVAHTDTRAIEVDATNCPGLYRVDFADAAFAAGVPRVQLVVNGAAIDPAVIEVNLDPSLATISDIKSDTVVLEAKIDSDALLFDADHDKTQSDVADLSTKLASDILALEGALDSDFLAVETKLDSDMVLETASHTKTQSDIALVDAAIDSDNTALHLVLDSDNTNITDKMDSDVVVADAKIDSDMTLLLADHDKTQSDIALVTITAADVADAVWDEKQSDHVAAGSMGKQVSDVYSDTTAFSVSAADIADAVWDELKSDHVAAGSMGELVSDIYSDTVVLEAKIDSDVVVADAKADSDMTLLLADHDKTQSDIALGYSDTTVIASDVAWLQAVIDGDWELITSTTPWTLRVSTADSSDALIQKHLYQADGTAVTSANHMVGKQLETAT